MSSMQSRLAQMEREVDEFFAGNNGNTEQSTTNEQQEEQREQLQGETLAEQPTSQDNKPAEQHTDDVWKKRYEILQGKYNAEVKRYQQEIEQLKRSNSDPLEVERLRNRVVDLERQLESQAKQPSNNQNNNAPSIEVDDYLVSEFGEEFAQAVAQQAAKHASSIVNERMQQVQKDVDGRFNQISQSTAEQRLESTLKENGVNFRQIDNDPLFIDWLQEGAPYSSKTKHQLMIEAFQAGDVSTTAQFYIDYMRSIEQKPKQQNPLQESVSEHDNKTRSDQGGEQMSQAQITQMIVKNEEDFLKNRISEQVYNQREAELFNMLG